MRSLFAIVLLSLLANSSSAECECLWQGSFVEVQHKTDLVVAGEVIAGKGNSIDVAIARTLRGNPTATEIRVWLKTGSYCRPPATEFPVNSSWVMALQRITEDVPGGFNPGTPNISYGRIGDYQLSSCGGYWLQWHKDHVTGALVNSPRWVHDPDMTPVLLDLVVAFVNGKADVSALLSASKEDPALQELMLDTRAFLRGDEN